jgi:hypothetical protein
LKEVCKGERIVVVVSGIVAAPNRRFTSKVLHCLRNLGYLRKDNLTLEGLSYT